MGIIIKASGIFTKRISDLINKALKVLLMVRQKFQSSFIFPTLQCRLSDACVKPILLYCSEIWRPYSLDFVKIASKINNHSTEESQEDFLPERIHSKFCKFLIGLNKYSSNLACKSEVGRYPLAIPASLLSLKYWLHINDDGYENPKAHDKFIFFQSLLNGNKIKSSFGDQIKSLGLITFGKIKDFCFKRKCCEKKVDRKMQNFDVNKNISSLLSFVTSFKTIFLKSDFKYIFNDFRHVYIAPVQGRQPLADTILMSTERSYHFAHLLQVSKHLIEV